MTDVFDDQKIDLVTISPDGSSVGLYIVQSGNWTGSDEQLYSLQAKIHNYVGFALDGQMVRTYPNTANLAWEIVISCLTGPPDSQTQFVLDQLVGVLANYGGALRVELDAPPPSA